MNRAINGTKTYKWVIIILITLIMSIASFSVGGQMITPKVRENIRRIDRNELHIQTINNTLTEIKDAIKLQNAKLDEIRREIH